MSRPLALVPLDYMLAVMRDEDAEPWRRDEMAKAAAPYVHPRLAAIATGGDVNTNIAERLERALARVDGPEQSENYDQVRPDSSPPCKAEAPRPPRPTGAGDRSVRQRRQNVAGKVQKVAGPK